MPTGGPGGEEGVPTREMGRRRVGRRVGRAGLRREAGWGGAGPVACGLGREKRRVRVAGWAAEMGWAGAGLSLALGLFSISLFLILKQSNTFEFKQNLNSNHTQMSKINAPA